MLVRIIGALATAAALFVGLALPYFAVHRNLLSGVLAVVGFILALVVARWAVVRRIGFVGRSAFVGAAVFFVVTATMWPYRQAVTAWGLTPETSPAQWAIGTLYVGAAASGAFLGSFVSLPIRPRQGGRIGTE